MSVKSKLTIQDICNVRIISDAQMEVKLNKKQKTTMLFIFLGCMVVLIVGIVLTAGNVVKHESIRTVMKDAVLHDENHISFLGIKDVNPALISAYTVTAIVLFIALIIRICVIPKFQMIPGKFQLLLEEWVGFFEGLAKSNSPHRHRFLGSYLFAAGSYIFLGTIFELFGLQAVTTSGHSIAMPAPLADINAALAMGFLSYNIILSGGIAGNKFKGVLLTLKDFSLPLSMSFRLFGALLSGALVTELVYYYITMSFVLPVIVGVLFTLLHAIIQCYVLTMLTSIYYGEVSEHHEKKEKKKKVKKKQTMDPEEGSNENIKVAEV